LAEVKVTTKEPLNWQRRCYRQAAEKLVLKLSNNTKYQPLVVEAEHVVQIHVKNITGLVIILVV